MEETPLEETRECRRSLPCKEYLRMEERAEDGGGGVDEVMTELALSSSEVRAATQRSRSGPFCKRHCGERSKVVQDTEIGFDQIITSDFERSKIRSLGCVI